MEVNFIKQTLTEFVFAMQFVEDAFELKPIEIELNITNVLKEVEICDIFGYNFLNKFTWFVQNNFKKVDCLRVYLNDGKNVSEVLKKLSNLKVIYLYLSYFY